MEQYRMVLAVSLSVLVLLAWGYLFPKQPQPQKAPAPTTGETASGTAPKGDSQGAVSPGGASGQTQTALSQPAGATVAGTAPVPPGNVQPLAPARLITVETPLYTVRLSERGAEILNLSLNNYRETNEKHSPAKDLVRLPEGQGTAAFSFGENGANLLTDAVYSASQSQDAIKVTKEALPLEFIWTSPQGVRVSKTFRFSPDSYLVKLDVQIENGSAALLKGSSSVSLRGIITQVSKYAFSGPVCLMGRSFKEISLDDVRKGKITTLPGAVEWSGITTQYFLSALISDPTAQAALFFSVDPAGTVETTYQRPAVSVAPGQKTSFTHEIFFGPKSLAVLNQSGNHLGRALNFGWFDIIAKPFLYLMNFIHGLYPNYGLSIIILTILVKLAFWPLGNKSYESMEKMKMLQPEMQAIRDKYKDDKQKLNEETMRLYRTYKINPLGGCLPLLLQIPVFIALYRMLYGAIELRHAPFALWINDLSAPDRLLRFGFAIPFMDPPYGIPVLTVIMGVTMFLQQKMSPPPGDPMQAKIMLALPIVFTIMFINFPSGLVLYWLVNNVISMAQQKLVTKKRAQKRRS